MKIAFMVEKDQFIAIHPKKRLFKMPLSYTDKTFSNPLNFKKIVLHFRKVFQVKILKGQTFIS